MSTPYGSLSARRAYPPQTYRGRHSRPDPGLDPGSALPWLLTGLGALLLATVILAIAVPGLFVHTEFDELALQRGVAQVLTDNGYSVGPVSCPAAQPVEVGHRFSCRASIDGEQREVTITVRTSGGEYEVAAPR